MGETEDDTVAPTDPTVETVVVRRRREPWRLVVAAALAVFLVLLFVLYFSRIGIANRVIASQLRGMGIPATYKVVAIGTRKQVLTDVVLGDPAHPDLTIKRLTVYINPRFGIPTLGKLIVEEPRLYGTWHEGKPSFGSLDKALFEGPGRAFRLPKLDLAVHDGRALIRSDYGPIGLKVEGQGQLREGFAGFIAAAAPRLAGTGCAITGASLFGAVTIAHERPAINGPVRVGDLSCPGTGVAMHQGALNLQVLFDQPLNGAEGQARLESGAAAYGGTGARHLTGNSQFTWRGGDVTATYRLGAGGVGGAQLGAAGLALNGTLRTRNSYERMDLEGNVAGVGLRLGNGLDAALRGVETKSAGTLLAPLVAQLRGALAREAPGSKLAGSYVVRRTGSVFSAILPSAVLTGGSGADLVRVTRLQYAGVGRAAPRLAGNFATGGPGLPRIDGRIEQEGNGAALIRMIMADYAAGNSRLGLPELVVALGNNGAVGFGGTARLSGPLPGGSAQNLVLPLDGNWSAARGLSAWRRCTPIAFDKLTYANLTLDRRALTLCPGPDGAIVRYDGRGLRFAAGAPSLALSGHIGSTAIRLSSGAIGFAIPGAVAARNVDVSLGPPATATQFRLANLTAQIGKDVTGRFAGTDAKLFAVPLDLLGATGNWRYAAGRLTVTDGDFRLVDRRPAARFEPLVAHGASLTLFNNLITADAVLHEPRTERVVTAVKLTHNLATARGHADLSVPGILFDGSLQPTTLTQLALGVIANAQGTVRGNGQIDWGPRGVTSTGDFSTDHLDFAAAFGPVKGASGTVHFTDLLGMQTAPGQQLHVASVNPGIEVTDGVITFQLQHGQVLQLQGAKWPFMGGTLELKPVALRLGVAESRKYVLVVMGLDAEKFVQRMELANISASGIFDGELPLVFDQNGGRIEGGHLAARPPGGNVSYVGALSYKNMGAIANFAFEALRSLDYRKMDIAMDGALEGEIVTRVRFDQVRQGAGAKKNFITQRFAKLPIQFNVNVKAPFYQLITSFKSLNDPAFVKDPRDIGLLDAEGRPLRPAVVNPKPPAPVTPASLKPKGKTPRIQPPASRKKP